MRTRRISLLAFVLEELMDDFNGAGVIPASLVYWQLTGDKSMLEAAIGDR